MIARSELMLVLLAQQGDREALNSLLALVQPRLFRYIRGVLRSDSNSAEDVLQETLLRIVRKLGWLTEPHAFEAWIYRIASNEAYRAVKRSHRHPQEGRATARRDCDHSLDTGRYREITPRVRIEVSTGKGSPLSWLQNFT